MRKVTSNWLNNLPRCKLAQARELIKGGAELVVHLDRVSTMENPLWRVTVLDLKGAHWAIIGVKEPLPRELRSVQRVYQMARNLGLSNVAIPVDLEISSN